MPARTRRYAAFLRGVMPMNAKMADLKRAFEAAGFEDVKTVLSSGNVVFSAHTASATTLQRKAEAAMDRELGRSFMTIVRPLSALRALVESTPYASFRLAPGSKRIVTFLRQPPEKKLLRLPVEVDGARILAIRGAEAFSVYVRTPKGPVFMTLIEKTLGKEVTTRTWETVERLANN
jgi:uncharacterized protein (DUF1697 family)